MKELRNNAGYAAMQGLYWMLYCVAFSFASVFLLAKGYSNTEIGLILAAGNAAALVVQPLVAAVADSARHIGPVGLIALGAGALVCVAVGLLWFAPHTPGLTLLYVLLLCGTMALQPLVNAFAFYLERRGLPVRFGVARGVGSLSYAVLCSALGALSSRLGEWVLPVAALVLLGLWLALMAGFGAHRQDTGHGGAQAAAAAAPAPAESKSPRAYPLLLAATVLLFFAHAFIANFTIQIVQTCGGGVGQMGALLTFSAVMELPAMFLFDALRRRFRCGGMLRFAAVFFCVKMLVTLAADSIPLLFLSMAFQSVAFALFIPASVRYVNDILPAAQMNKGQAFLSAAITAGNILSSLSGGYLIDTIGMRPTLALATGLTVAGAVILWLGMAGAPQKN